MKKFSKKLNRYTTNKIVVKEFLTPGSTPEEAFKKMVESGAQCDGLVISGHHTGSFGGKNAIGSLSVDFMEKLSCKQEYKKFFSNIKALWLQGCRTLGVGKIESYDTADNHTERVGAVLSEDDLEQSFAQLNIEFSATLDQDNPLSSRYLRVFPRASVFGWTKTAPGVRSHSELSIPFHIANMAQISDDRGRYFDNPVGEISKQSAVKYLDAINKILQKDSISSCGHCPSTSSDAVIAWLHHGTPAEKRKYFFNNPDLNAYQPLFVSNDEFLKKAKELECILKNTSDLTKLLSILDEILKDETLIGYSFNSIYELLQRFTQEGNIDALIKMQDKLKSSPLLNKFLMRKLASQELGIMRKIDYYAFWSRMTGEQNEHIEKLIRKSFVKLVLTPGTSYEQRDFKLTLLNSMSKHELLTGAELKKIIDFNELDTNFLSGIANAICYSKKPIEGASELLNKIINSDKIDGYVLSGVAYAIGKSKEPIEGASNILQQIINSDKSDGYSLSSVADAIGNSKEPIEGASKMLQQITSSDKSNGYSLGSVAYTIGISKEPIEGASKMLHQIINSDKSTGYSFSGVAYAIGNSKKPIKGTSEMLQRIVKSKEVSGFGLSHVAYAIGNSNDSVKGAWDMIKMIYNSKKQYSSLSLAYAIKEGKNIPRTEGEKMLKEIMQSKKFDSTLLQEVEGRLKSNKYKSAKMRKFIKYFLCEKTGKYCSL